MRSRSFLSVSKLAFWLILPSILVIFPLIIYPIFSSLHLSFFTKELTNPFIGTPFVGLRNYIDILRDAAFWSSFWKTVYFTVVSISLEVVLGVAVSLLLNEKFAGRGVLRSLILVPWALPVTVNGIMWKWILNSSYGALNSLLYQLGLISSYRAWLSEPFMAMNMAIVAEVWKVTPLVVLLLLAALQTIPHQLYEAATVDGASAWRKFRHITLPLLQPTILIILVLRTLDAFKVFDLIFVMTRGGPANGTMVLSYFTYIRAFRFLNFGQGAALSYVITLFIGLIALLYTRVMRSDIEY
ncbi:MAG: sugar ABC transporter permease [Firmicutes bacterium]|nr:sugar ABC transporter permease [Bacillota bacterium]